MPGVGNTATAMDEGNRDKGGDITEDKGGTKRLRKTRKRGRDKEKTG